jgi:hypothetical protein
MKARHRDLGPMQVNRPANPEELRTSRVQESDRLKTDLKLSDVENNPFRNLRPRPFEILN